MDQEQQRDHAEEAANAALMREEEIEAEAQQLADEEAEQKGN